MKTHDIEYFKHLANKIMIDLSDEEIVSLQADFKDMLEQLEVLNQIDTTHVSEMIYPFDTATTYLRDDEEMEVLAKDEVLQNAKEYKEGQIVVPKVVG